MWAPVAPRVGSRSVRCRGDVGLVGSPSVIETVQVLDAFAARTAPGHAGVDAVGPGRDVFEDSNPPGAGDCFSWRRVPLGLFEAIGWAAFRRQRGSAA